MESALRDDLSMAMTDRIDVQILSGDGNGANLSGFFDGAGGPLDAAELAPDDLAGFSADPVAPPTKAASSFDVVSRLVRNQVDGLYAEGEGALRLLVGPDWYRLCGGIYRATEGDVSVNDYLRTRLEGYRVNANVPPSGGARKPANGLAVRGMQRAAVAPVWEGVRLIRDEITGAASGEVALTAIAMVDFAVLRKAQYRYIQIPTA